MITATIKRTPLGLWSVFIANAVPVAYDLSYQQARDLADTVNHILAGKS